MPVILLQTDLKKLLAFSTIVNISFLYLIIVVSNYKLTCCYFVVHGLFKSLSFIMLGIFIINNKHSQDYRSYNNITLFNSFASLLFFFSIFFLSGFNFLFIYKIKHFFDFKNSLSSNFLYFIDIIFVYYSVLSVFYAIKVFYFLYIKKSSNNLTSINMISSLSNYNSMYYITKIIIFYLFLSVSISYFLYISLLYSEFFYLANNDSKALLSLYKIGMSFVIYLSPMVFISIFNKKKYFFIKNICFLLLLVFLFI